MIKLKIKLAQLLFTAHPYKFLETVESVIGEKLEPPIQASFLGQRKVRYNDFNINNVKKYRK